MAGLRKKSGDVTIRENEVFGTTGGRDLSCDVFLPAGDGNNRAGILLIHGGSWMHGDKSQLSAYGVQLARYGFVTVCCEYRLSGEAPWPAQIQDCKAALRWMRANATSLGIDPNKIAVSGNSAGGHLALLMGATANEPEFEGTGGNAGVGTSVCAVAAIYPPTRLQAGGQLDTAVGQLFADPDVSQQVQDKASPITWSRQSFPPTLLVHGNNDRVVDVSETLNMYHQLRKEGAKVEMHIYEGAPHAFDREPDFFNQIENIIALFISRQLGQAKLDD